MGGGDGLSVIMPMSKAERRDAAGLCKIISTSFDRRLARTVITIQFSFFWSQTWYCILPFENIII